MIRIAFMAQGFNLILRIGFVVVHSQRVAARPLYWLEKQQCAQPKSRTPRYLELNNKKAGTKKQQTRKAQIISWKTRWFSRPESPPQTKNKKQKHKNMK